MVLSSSAGGRFYPHRPSAKGVATGTPPSSPRYCRFTFLPCISWFSVHTNCLLVFSDFCQNSRSRTLSDGRENNSDKPCAENIHHSRDSESICTTSIRIRRVPVTANKHLLPEYTTLTANFLHEYYSTCFSTTVPLTHLLLLLLLVLFPLLPLLDGLLVTDSAMMCAPPLAPKNDTDDKTLQYNNTQNNRPRLDELCFHSGRIVAESFVDLCPHRLAPLLQTPPIRPPGKRPPYGV